MRLRSYETLSPDGETVTESEALRIMQQLAARYGMQPLAAGEFTVAMFAEANHMTYNMAKNVLDKAIAAGAIEYVGQRTRGGHTSHAYLVVGKE
jgi:hypothetical protein